MKKITVREEEVLNKSLEILISEYHPKRIFLFGSRSKGTNYTNSDFDFAADMKEPNIKLKNRVEEKLDKIGLYKIDIIFLQSVDEEFKNIISKSGELLYEQ